MIKLYNHQKIAIKLSLKRKSFALFLETGTGKTLIALINSKIRMKHNQIDKCIIVCPKSVVLTWVDEMRKVELSPIYIYNSTKKEREKIVKKFFSDEKERYLVINYDSIIRMQDILINFLNPKVMLIFDETTFIKNPRAKRTKVSMKMSDRARYKLILSGTPITNNLMDVFSQMYIIDKSYFGYSWYKFRENFFIPDYMRWNWRPKEETYYKVEKCLSEVSYRIKKEDCIDLPPKIYEKHYIFLTEEQRKMYDDMANKMITRYENEEISVNTILAQMQKLQQIINGFIYNDDNTYTFHTSKLDAVLEIIETNFNSKIIIWVYYNADKEVLYDKLKQLNYNIDILDSNNVDIVLDKIKKSGQYIIISNPASCGYGINLTGIDICIYYSNSFNSILRYQSEDRCHRIGTKNKVVYIDIIAKDTIDEKIFYCLKKKQDLMKEILDVKSFLTKQPSLFFKEEIC